MPSLTGHPLIGNRLTKFVYLDETAIDPSEDKDTIVAGVFVSPDSDIQAINNGLNEVMLSLIPEQIYLFESTIKPGGYVFHAKDYIGCGKKSPFKALKADGKWDSGRGLDVASALVDVIEGNNIKCVWGGSSNSNGVKIAHMNALMKVALRVDHFMLANHPEEICMLIAEDISHRGFIKENLNILRSQMAVIANGLDGSLFPLRTIKETVHFVGKNDCRAIQLADTVCYIVKKSLEGNKHYEALARRMQSILLS